MDVDRRVFRDTLDAGQVIEGCEGYFFDRSKTRIQQQTGDIRVDLRKACQLLAGHGHALHLGFDLGFLFDLALDVEIPAHELAGQPNVLAALADGQGKLVLADDHLHLALLDPAGRHAIDRGRVEGVAYVLSRVVVELDDVDLFAAKLADHGLNTRTLHSHARPDGIDVAILGPHGDLATLAGITGDGDDADGSVVDFRNLHLEQLPYQQLAGS